MCLKINLKVDEMIKFFTNTPQKVSTLCTSFCIASLMGLTSIAHAGGDPGGGVGIRCDGKLTSLERFEAKQQGIQLIANPQSYDAAKEIFTNLLKNKNKNKETSVSKINEAFNFVNLPEHYDNENRISIVKESKLKLTHDWGEIHTPDGKIPDNCKLEQIIRWEGNEEDDKNTIKVDNKRFSELDYLDKIIYIFHEPLYAYSREVGDTSSELTRENVIDLLKVEQSNSIAKQISNESPMNCKVKLNVKDSSTLFSLSDEGNKKERVKSFTNYIREQFEKLNTEKKTNYTIDESSKSELELKLYDESSISSYDKWKFKLSGTLNEIGVEGLGEGYLTSEAVSNAIQNLIVNLPKCEN